MRRLACVLGLMVGGCRHPSALLPTQCDPMRIGRVTIHGAGLAEVPGLAVLEGTIDDRVRTERIARLVANQLADRGYARALVAIRRIPSDCFGELAVDVTLGPKFSIASLDVIDNSDFPYSERTAAFTDSLGTVNSPGGTYIAYRLTRALDNLAQRYRDAGWLDVVVGKPRVHYDDDAAAIAIEIPVTAGRRYRIAAIRARGAAADVRAVALAAIELQPGAWYDGPKIRIGIERARRRLARPIELHTSQASDRGEIELEAVIHSDGNR